MDEREKKILAMLDTPCEQEKVTALVPDFAVIHAAAMLVAAEMETLAEVLNISIQAMQNTVESYGYYNIKEGYKYYHKGGWVKDA